MMKWLFTGLIFISFSFGLFNGRLSDVSNSIMLNASEAVSLMISLMGNMCLWSGVMLIAKKSGLTHKISHILKPVTSLLFRGIPDSSPVIQTISMNITANLLGLGNAATPLGILAMRQLSELAPVKNTASNHMITLVVLNTASIQIIPTTLAFLRLNHGSRVPLDILPAILITSAIALISGILMVKFCSVISSYKHK